MGLFTPWFLAGIATIGLPLYLHLLRRHSVTPQPFSSLMFFEPRTQSSMRHRRLRYLLLLSLRIAVLVLLALAFANPFISRPAASAPSGTLVLLVVDSSFSMRAGTRLNDARREALAVLASRRGADRVQVMSLDSELHQLTEAGRDAADERAAINGIQPGDSRGSFAELARAVRLMADASPGPIELHLFSDLQRMNMGPSFAEMAFPSNVTLILHPTVKGAVPNWTVENVTAPAMLWGRPKEGKKAARVQAVIAGFGTQAAARTASLRVNGKTTATATVQVPAGGRATVEFPSLDVPYGFSRCEVRIDSADALPDDDGYLFAVERSDPERVLFIHGAGDTRSALFFGNALDAAAESAFDVQSVTADQLVNQALSKYAFIVLSDIPALQPSIESALTGYVNAGGSVLLTLGTASAGRSRVPILGDSIQRIHDYARETGRGGERFLPVGEVDASHAALAKTGTLAGVKFYYVVGVDSAASHVIARLTDQTPLILDRKMGEGRALLFTSGFDNLTNDFPLHPAFVAFVEQTALYLSGTEHRLGARVVDSFFDLRTAEGQNAPSNLGVEVIDPEGRRPLSLTEAATTQSLRLSKAGFYQVRLANGRQDVIGVNPDRRESNLGVMADDVLALWRGSPQQHDLTAFAAGTALDRKEPYGLWWFIMALLLAAALLESLVASRHLDTPREES